MTIKSDKNISFEPRGCRWVRISNFRSKKFDFWLKKNLLQKILIKKIVFTTTTIFYEILDAKTHWKHLKFMIFTFKSLISIKFVKKNHITPNICQLLHFSLSTHVKCFDLQILLDTQNRLVHFCLIMLHLCLILPYHQLRQIFIN